MASIKKKGLGKGLDALFGEETATAAQDKYTSAQERKALASGEVKIKTTAIVPNPDQPRKHFDTAALDELSASIKEHGILTPLIVKREGEKYIIIAGERRWRAAQLAGIKELPVVVRDYDDRQTAEISLIENLQREDLNPVEEAQAYAMLIANFNLTQEEVAQRVSKNRTTITNSLRLLKLAPEVQELIVDGVLSAGQARAILGVEDVSRQKALAEEAVQNKLSVRDVEKRVKALSKNKPLSRPKEVQEERDLSIFYKEYEDRMRNILGTKVSISRKDNSKGRIEIEYYSQDELERIMELFQSIRE